MSKISETNSKFSTNQNTFKKTSNKFINSNQEDDIQNIVPQDLINAKDNYRRKQQYKKSLLQQHQNIRQKPLSNGDEREKSNQQAQLESSKTKISNKNINNSEDHTKKLNLQYPLQIDQNNQLPIQFIQKNAHLANQGNNSIKQSFVSNELNSKRSTQQIDPQLFKPLEQQNKKLKVQHQYEQEWKQNKVILIEEDPVIKKEKNVKDKELNLFGINKKNLFENEPNGKDQNKKKQNAIKNSQNDLSLILKELNLHKNQSLNNKIAQSVVKTNELFQSDDTKRRNEQIGYSHKIQISPNKQNTYPIKNKLNSNTKEKQIDLQLNNKQYNVLDDSIQSIQSNCLSMQPQGADSPMIESMSIEDLRLFDDNNDMNDGNIKQQNNGISSPRLCNNEDEDSDDICLKKKTIKEDIQEENLQLQKNQDNQHNTYIKENNNQLNDKEFFLYSPFKSPIKQQADLKYMNKSPSQVQQKINNIKDKDSIDSKDELKQLERLNENEVVQEDKNNKLDMQIENLQDISIIKSELFEIIQMPQDKTRVIWIFNSIYLIKKLSTNVIIKEEQELIIQNRKKFTFQITLSEDNKKIEFNLYRNNNNSKSNQQLQITLKFYAISNNEKIIEKVQNKNKMFSDENSSLQFSVPIDVSFILQNYEQIIFEATLYQTCAKEYNSKVETNYVGLFNEGQTCYLNSYIQTLFHIKAFIKLVYSIPTQREPRPKFPHTLQVLFYQLQSSKYHCKTIDLLKSFSWDRSKTKIQQDIQEFSCLFIDYLENQTDKIPQLKGQIANLFKGKIQNYISCINVDFESVREESFFEISLNLKGFENIYESLDDYVREELLQGEDKYDTGDQRYNKQDAKKGIKILELPPVLFFHLKRFQYDQTSGQNIKITDKHEYYEEIDLSKYIPNASSDKCYKYSLFAVLVHSGTMSTSGHYYAYINPNPKENSWFKFNDSIIEYASKKQVLDFSFGGKFHLKEFDKIKKNFVRESSSINSTAYMLVYINQKDQERILGEVPNQQIPQWIINQEQVFVQQKSTKQKYSKSLPETFQFLCNNQILPLISKNLNIFQ